MNSGIDWLSRVLPDRAIHAFFSTHPQKKFRDLMRISDSMARRSEEIVAEKKAMLAKGDTALAHEVGEGKDIMSICRKLEGSRMLLFLWLTDPKSRLIWLPRITRR